MINGFLPNNRYKRTELVEDCIPQFSLRVCTFSRILKEKGIEDAIKAVKLVNDELGRDVFLLDIFGEVDNAQSDWFNNVLKCTPSYVRNCGIVPFDKSTSILKDYYALIFPTYYSGEGFAGTLIDALASGLPAIVSDWKYNKEIVQDYETGIVYPARDIGALAEKLLWIYHHQTEWNAMRYRCLKKANDYMPEEALKELELRLG